MKHTFRIFFAMALGTLSLLLSEIYTGSFSTYALLSSAADMLSLSVFGGIALGNIIGLNSRLRLSPIGADWILTAVLQISTFMLCRWEYNLGSVWISLPFVGYGICFSRLFSKYDLKTLIIALGISGVFLGFIYFFLIRFFPLEIQWLTVIAPLATAVLFSNKTLKPVILIASIATTMHFYKIWEPLPRLSHKTSDIKEARPFSPPRINALFRTDLLLRPNGQFLYLLNGIRFGAIPSKHQIEKALEGGPPRPFTHELPYFFVKPKSVLIIGSSEGKNVLAALRFHVEKITALDINPHVFELFKEDIPEIGNKIYNRPEVETVVAEGRNYLSQTDKKFDLITLQGVHAQTDVTSGEFLKVESYLFTKEALQLAWSRLSKDGALFIDDYNFFSMENKRLLKIFADVAAQEFGFDDPSKHIILVDYIQGVHSPAFYKNNTRKRAIRTGLIISKKELEVTKETQKIFAESKYNFSIENYTVEENKIVPTDDRPVFFTLNILFLQNALFYFLFTGVILLSLFIYYIWGFGGFGGPPGYLALTGIGYMMIVNGLSGKLFLWLGHPAYVAPVLFTTLYVISLVGGLWVLNSTKKQSVIATVFFFGLCLAAVVFDQRISSFLMSLGGIKFVGVIILIIFFAMLTEVPYIFGLRQYEGIQCASANAVEHVGNLIGAPLAILLQINYGYQTLFFSALVIFAFVIIMMMFRKTNR